MSSKLVGAGYSAGSVTSTPKDFIATGWGNAVVYTEDKKEKEKTKLKIKINNLQFFA